MKCKISKILLLLVISAILPQPVKAELVEELVKVSQPVRAQWIAVVEGQKMRLVKAEFKQEGSEQRVKAIISSLSPLALVCGVVETQSGEVFSSPLRSLK